MGYLRERQPGVWELIVEAPRDPVSGRRKQISRTFRGTEKKALAEMHRLELKVQEGKEGGTTATVETAVNRWLDLVAEDFSPTTLHTYRNYARRRIVPALGTRQLAKLRTVHLDEFYRALVRDEGMAPASVRQIHAILRGALAQAVRWGWIVINPAENATLPKRRKPEPVRPDAETVLRLFDLAETTDPDFAALMAVAADIGARRGELCALRWVDVDLESRSVRVARSLILAFGGRGSGTLEKDTKTHGVRIVALSAGTAAILTGVRERAEKRAADTGVELVADAFVFSRAPDGSAPLYPDGVTKTFAELCRRAGVVGVRFHDLRHFVATLLTAQKIDPRTVAGRLGHANPHTTLVVYSGWAPPADRAAADVIDEVLWSKRARPTTDGA